MAVKNNMKKLRKEQSLKQVDLKAYFKVHVDDIFHLEEGHTMRKCDENTP